MKQALTQWALAIISTPFLAVFLSAGQDFGKGYNPLLLLIALIVAFSLVMFLILKFFTFLRDRIYADVRAKQVEVPDYTPPKDLRFYEIGYLYDGEIDHYDIFATAVYYTIHQDKYDQADDLEKYIINRYVKQQGSMHSLLYDFQVDSLYADDADVLARAVYKDLQRKGYMLYNPGGLQAFMSFIGWVSTMYIWGGWIVLVMIFNRLTGESLDLGETNLIMLSVIFALWMIYIAALVNSFAHSFAERSELVIPLRTRLKGYRRYLKTADYFRVEKDHELFEKLAPYFIALRIKRKHWLRLFKHVVETYVEGGLQGYRNYAWKRREREKH